ncbi:MAG: hypothetical protein ACREK9_12820 [Candidatus Rokuibacteriota bacterium]
MRTGVYGPRGLRPGLSGLLAGAVLASSLAAGANPNLDCARPAEAHRLIGRLTLAEIEWAEDVHRAAMWDAFGRCPGGAAGEACRRGERRRFDAVWQRQKRQIKTKYRTMLAEFEQRCLAAITRSGRREPGASYGRPGGGG